MTISVSFFINLLFHISTMFRRKNRKAEALIYAQSLTKLVRSRFVSYQFKAQAKTFLKPGWSHPKRTSSFVTKNHSSQLKLLQWRSPVNRPDLSSNPSSLTISKCVHRDPRFISSALVFSTFTLQVLIKRSYLTTRRLKTSR